MEKLLTFMNKWLGKLYIPCSIPADKQMHFDSGTLLSWLILLVLVVCNAISIYFYGVRASLETMCYTSAFSVSLIAALKEYYDYKHKDKHTPDIWDWVATSLGGIVGTLLTKLVLFSL
jgi:hypothetical protein